jgi:two-component system, NarL family, sensor kinase
MNHISLKMILSIIFDTWGLLSSLFFLAFLSIVPVFLVGFLVWHNRRKFNQFLQEKEILKQLYENQILQSRMEIRDNTLRQMSVEIHDNIGQVLSAVKFRMHLISQNYPNEELRDAEAQLGRAIGELRDLNKLFHPDFVLSEGLTKALLKELALLEKSGSMVVHFETGDKAVILFRILQESLHNVMKHAQAKTLKLSIGETPDQTCFKLEDDGIGFIFDPMQLSGMGLKNIRERAHVLGADFQIVTQPGQGTLLSICLPHEKD